MPTGSQSAEPPVWSAASWKPLLDGCYTVDDAKLYPYLTALADSENLHIEPSSCKRRFRVPALVQQASDYLAVKDLTDSMANAVHILMGDRRAMVPKEEMQRYERGKAAQV